MNNTTSFYMYYLHVHVITIFLRSIDQGEEMMMMMMMILTALLLALVIIISSLLSLSSTINDDEIQTIILFPL